MAESNYTFISRRNKRKIPRILISSLILAIMLEQVLVPVAYARELAGPYNPANDQKFESIITETTPATSTPYIGEGHGVKSIIPALTDLSTSNLSANVVVPARVHKLEKENYRPNEEIKVVIDNGLNKEFKTELIDAIGTKVAVETETTETGAAKVITLNQPSSFRPGKYTLRISDNKGGVSEQDFSWGVLAVNPDKSIYAPNETADLAMAVLDEGGNMVCDAQVELQITDPAGKMTSLSTDNGKVIVNPECISHDFTLKPDYETHYKVGGIGQYKMLLKSQTKNGAFSISDNFEVRDETPFDVKRISATRIYPPNQYPVTMEITANQDFEGTISESVPGSFRISRPGEEVLTENEEIDQEISGSGSPSGVLAPKLQGPIGPAEVAGLQTDASVLGFSTQYSVGETNGARAPLGVLIPLLSMPFSGQFPVSQEFGESLVHVDHDQDLYASFGMHGHDGVDFATPLGTPIQAVDGGTVALAGKGDYGTTVIIQHSWGKSYYGHLNEVTVKDGDDVLRGSIVGKSGNTGITTGPHLHFGIKPDQNDSSNGYYGKVDPAYYLGMKQSAGVVLGAATKLGEEDKYTAPVSTDIQILTWKVKVKKGEKIKIGYSYLAPRISPQFYTIGPATFTDNNGKEVFHEQRKWQIAADALELKFKRGSFNKSICTAACTQTVTGIGFKPKAIIFEWIEQTTDGSTPHQIMGTGYATNNAGAIQERAVAYWSEDNVATSDTSRSRSDTKSILFLSSTDGSVIAEADFISMDADGFTLNWSTNNTSPFLIRYTALGGADISNAKAGTISLSTSTGTQAYTDPGFQPNFVLLMATGNNQTVDDPVNTTPTTGGAKMSLGFAASSTKQGAVTVMADDGETTPDTCREQRSDAVLVLFTNNCSSGTEDAVVTFSSMDATGFTLNKPSNAPLVTTSAFYLALQGGQYTVGSLAQPSTTATQSANVGFRPSGVSFASINNQTDGTVQTTSSLTLGGASLDKSASNSSNWCNDTTGITCTSAWSTRRKITFDNSQSTSDLDNFPVLVKLSSASANIDFDKTRAGGDDLRFVDPNNPNVVLPHEVESWDEPSGLGYVWVKVPKIHAGSRTDFIYMYYGNASAPNGQDGTNVWDSNYQMVYHLSENQAGIGNVNLYQDATANNRDCDDNISSTNKVGQVDGGQGFDDVDDSAGNCGTPSYTSGLTYSAWVRLTNVNAEIDRIITSAGATTHQLRHDGTSGLGQIHFELSTSGTLKSLRVNSQLTAGTWAYIVGTWDGTTMRVYNNGTLVGTNVPGGTLDAGGDVTLSSATETFDGNIDEVRISSLARSPSWVEAEYLTMNDQMNTYSPEQSGPLSGNVSGQVISQNSIFSEDRDADAGNENANVIASSKAMISYTASSGGGAPVVNSEADVTSLDPNGFTLEWTIMEDTNQRKFLYWAAGSTTASQEDYRWYKNNNALQPTEALEDENTATIVSKPGAKVRLRANMSVGSNGLNASTQGYKLQYAAAGSEAGVGATSDWCNDTTGITCTSDWGYRRKITFNNTASGSNLTNFPVLVKLDNSRVDYNKTQNSGQDIRFVDPSDPNTVLPHEIEYWDENGSSYVWVQVPQINANSNADYIYMYYGNSTIGDGQSVNSTWDSSFAAVWHLKENPATTCSTTKEFCDSTSKAHHGDANGGMVVANHVVGKVDGAVTFDDVDDYIDMGNITEVHNIGGATISMWAKRGTETGKNIAAQQAGGNEVFAIQVWSDGFIYFGAARGAPGEATTSMPDTQWHYITMVFDGSQTGNANRLKGYVDGQPRLLDFGSSTIQTTTTSDTSIFAIGRDGSAGTSRANGITDEVRLATAARSADYVEADYLTQTDQLAVYGDEQPFTTGGTSAVTWTDVGAPWCNDTTGTPLTCDKSWAYRKVITIDNQSSSSALTNFPVLIKLNNANIDYSKTQNSGQDIRFVDPSDNTTVLAHEIERWDEAGDSYVWVTVPQIDANSVDSIIMYYGNTSIADGQSVNGTWNSNYRGVWHLKENPAVTCASTQEICDSTSNAYNGDANGTMTSGDSVFAKVYNGLDFDGVDDNIDMGDQSGLDYNGTGITVSAWFKNKSLPDTDSVVGIVSKNTFASSTSNGGYEISLRDNSSVKTIEFGLYNSAGSAVNNFANAPFTDADAWHNVVGTYDGTTISLYLDGVLVDTTAYSGGIKNITQAFAIGRETTVNFFPGVIDEVRVSDSVRSAEWIQAEYRSINDQMVSYGTEQTQAQALWTFKDNAGVTDETTIPSTAVLLSTSTAGNQMSYQESNPTILNPSALAVGEKREFDFSLDGTNASARRTYYFRLVDAEGTPFTIYSRYPSIMVGQPNDKTMRGGKFFNYKKTQPFSF